ncbi:hypothetical protein [Acidithiobacillus concretivorus]|nr:hypothetical protein [Acidithiobacillus concretivorus]
METMIIIHDDSKVFKVEFVMLSSDPFGVLTLAEDEIRPVSARDVPHVREL